MSENTKLSEMKTTLNKTGCGFCLAKWTQVTIHLQMGQTHSCHHPTSHKISKVAIKRNPSALHNTRQKKRARKEMLEGKRPSECEYCWKIEDNSPEFSDRVYKSNEPWSKPYLDEIKELGWRSDFNPKYVEVSFSNVCNFKCSYCGPSYSSKWMQEIKKYGEYPTSTKFNDIKWLEDDGKMPIHHLDDNPYVEAFWKWWPDLYHDLHTFRITGGEPLLMADTWKLLDYIIDNPTPNKELKLGINTNLGVPDELIDKLIEKLKIIEKRGLVKELIIYTSCDTSGEQAEYVRHGLVYDKFVNNVDKLLSSSERISIVIMSTFNALSIPRYKELLRFGYDMKKKHNNKNRYWQPSLFIDSSYLRYPLHQTVKLLPVKWIDKVNELAEYADGLRFVNKTDEEQWYPHHMGFTDIEIDKIKRIADWMGDVDSDEEITKNRKDFYKFFSNHDKRRGTDFCKTFPELAEFYNECKQLI